MSGWLTENANKDEARGGAMALRAVLTVMARPFTAPRDGLRAPSELMAKTKVVNDQSIVATHVNYCDIVN